jgi:hypothetical protein
MKPKHAPEPPWLTGTRACPRHDDEVAHMCADQERVLGRHSQGLWACDIERPHTAALDGHRSPDSPRRWHQSLAGSRHPHRRSVVFGRVADCDQARACGGRAEHELVVLSAAEDRIVVGDPGLGRGSSRMCSVSLGESQSLSEVSWHKNSEGLTGRSWLCGAIRSSR